MNLFWSMLGVGLVTSLSHCVFMCGGLVLTYAVRGADEGPAWRRFLPHLVYQGAKIVSYATVALVLGALVAALGSAFDITPVRNWLLVIAGVYMMLIGVSMTGRFPALAVLTPRPPRFLTTALSKMRRGSKSAGDEGPSLATPLLFGLLTGLMPCAPLIAAQAAAISSGSPLTGALGMVGFGLGTAPALVAFGFVSTMLSARFRARLQLVGAVAIMVFGLVIFNRGLMVVGSPVTFEAIRTAATGGAAPSSARFTRGADGVVEVPLVIENVRFAPSALTLPADEPVRLIVDRREADACSKQLAIPQAGVLADLADNGVTKVDVPAMKAGSYTLTCGMGMMAGSITVGAAAAPGGVPGWAWMVLAAAAILAAWIGIRRSRAPKPTSERSAEPAVGILGFTPVEIVLGLAAIGVAILAGLAFGGFFR